MSHFSAFSESSFFSFSGFSRRTVDLGFTSFFRYSTNFLLCSSTSASEILSSWEDGRVSRRRESRALVHLRDGRPGRKLHQDLFLLFVQAEHFRRFVYLLAAQEKAEFAVRIRLDAIGELARFLVGQDKALAVFSRIGHQEIDRRNAHLEIPFKIRVEDPLGFVEDRHVLQAAAYPFGYPVPQAEGEEHDGDEVLQVLVAVSQFYDQRHFQELLGREAGAEFEHVAGEDFEHGDPLYVPKDEVVLPRSRLVQAFAQDEREVFKHAIAIEEAHHILLRKKQEMTKTEAITDIILREIRELGEAIILIDQHPSLISMPALGNTYTTLCFGLKHKADMFTISESLLLEKEQVDFLGQLETGLAIVKLQGRFFKPFLVRFPLFPIRKGVVSDSDLLRRNGSDSEESGVVRLDKEINTLARAVEGLANKKEKQVVVTEDERRSLADIARNPISGVVARYARMGNNRYQGNQIQGRLLEKKLISWKPVSTRKGRLKVLVLTDEGKKAIPDVKVEKVFHKSGSWEHEYWKQRGRRALQAKRIRGHL